MKRVITVFLAIIMCLYLTACDNSTVINIDGNVRCKWGMSIDDVRKQEKLEIVYDGKDDSSPSSFGYGLSYFPEILTKGEQMYPVYQFESDKLVCIRNYYSNIWKSGNQIINVFEKKLSELTAKYGEPELGPGGYAKDKSVEFVGWEHGDNSKLPPKEEWTNIIEKGVFALSYIWHTENTAIELVLLWPSLYRTSSGDESAPIYISYCDMNSEMYKNNGDSSVLLYYQRLCQHIESIEWLTK